MISEMNHRGTDGPEKLEYEDVYVGAGKISTILPEILTPVIKLKEDREPHQEYDYLSDLQNNIEKTVKDFRLIQQLDHEYQQRCQITLAELTCLNRAYNSILVDLRTLVDPGKKSVSLQNLLVNVIKHISHFTLQRHVNTSQQSGFREFSNRRFRHIIGNCLELSIVNRHLSELKHLTSEVKTIVDRFLAHKEYQATPVSLDLTNIKCILDRISQIFEFYFLHITGYSISIPRIN